MALHSGVRREVVAEKLRDSVEERRKWDQQVLIQDYCLLPAILEMSF
jgi:hypothetical protein